MENARGLDRRPAFMMLSLFLAIGSLIGCGGGGGGNSGGGSNTTYYRDADGDGYGDPAGAQTATSQPGGYVTDNTDCDDTNAAIHPAATEVADGVDNNCDGQVDEGVAGQLPSMSIADASISEGDNGTVSLIFTVSLSAPSTTSVSVDYATSDTSPASGSATAGSDYIAASGTLIIPAGSTSGTVTVSVIGDTMVETNETFTLELTNPIGSNLVTDTATGTILNDEASVRRLNDTGQVSCFTDTYISSAGLPCNDVSSGTDAFPGQDAEYGRDVVANDDSDGHAGFSYTKLDNNGTPLSASATSWECVRDEVTGLTWEVKTLDGGLRDATHTYTWYNTDTATNGGFSGVADGGVCSGSACDTQSYVQAINAIGLCGFNDWRMPTAEELSSLIDISVLSPNPSIDSRYFPNTQKSPDYWSGSPSLNILGNIAWQVDFSPTASFDIWEADMSNARHVRLVRD